MLKKVSSVSEEEARALTLCLAKNGYYFWEDPHYNAVELIKGAQGTHLYRTGRDPIVSEEEGRIAYADAIGDNMTFMSFKGVPGSQPHFDE